MHLSPSSIFDYILQFGVFVAYIILFAIIFAESGLLIGFFLPGDSLLFTAGFLASQGVFNIYILVLLFFIAAVFGDSAGYAFGRRFGKKLFERKDSLLFHKDNLLKTRKFYQKHGKKTLILARFLPVVRTFAPIIAGIADMHYPTFLVYNVIGGLLWGVGVTLAGFFIGSLIPDVDRYLIPIIFLIVFISVAPTVYHVLKDKENREQLIKMGKRVISKILKRQKV